MPGKTIRSRFSRRGAASIPAALLVAGLLAAWPGPAGALMVPAPQPPPAPVVARIIGLPGAPMEATLLMQGGRQLNVHAGDTIPGWKIISIDGNGVSAAPSDDPEHAVILPFGNAPPQ
jgi:type IV pilus biogenesis protein PilP